MEDHNNQKHKGHNHSPLKHMLHMLLCCGLPIVILALLPFISRLSPNAAGFIGKIVPFICPIMMVGMVVMMMGMGSSGKKKSCCDNTSEKNSIEDVV